jgi:hypothetical protein
VNQRVAASGTRDTMRRGVRYRRSRLERRKQAGRGRMSAQQPRGGGLVAAERFHGAATRPAEWPAAQSTTWSGPGEGRQQGKGCREKGGRQPDPGPRRRESERRTYGGNQFAAIALAVMAVSSAAGIRRATTTCRTAVGLNQVRLFGTSRGI